jgi:hypothetical protein
MSLKFEVVDTLPTPDTKRITDICDFLTAKVLYPFLTKHKDHWDYRFIEFFTHEKNCNPFDATGTIDFYPPPRYDNYLGELEESIRFELSKLNIETGPFQYENHPGRMVVRVIHIPVLVNPTGESTPPDVSLSETAACIVLRDILGYQHVNGRFEFRAEDLLKRVSSVTDETIRNRSAAPMKDLKSTKGVVSRPSPATAKTIRRGLDELRQLASWAMNHNCYHLMAE